jgi:ABC-type sugar transport system ATPase subunit
MCFTDYARPAMRLAALMKVPTVFVMTHDSIGLGEDGPTHQPIEHLAALRAMPNLTVLRPADANETAEAWKFAVKSNKGPTVLALTRQSVPTFDRSNLGPAELLHRGAYVLKDEKQIQRNLEYVYSLFPTLRERQEQAASTLSGGEQQMVAIGRGLMSNPQLFMLDEPSLGLAPRLVDEVLGTVRRLKQEGITILLVEQNVRESLDMADRGYVIQTGRVVLEGSGEELLGSDLVRKAFLGL